MGVIFTLYITCLVFFLFYSLFQLHILFTYNRLKKDENLEKEPILTNLPKVTVQLPIYNELYVAKRIIDEVAALDYPLDKLEIQVLDDSTDETVSVIAQKVAELQKLNINIKHITRTNRAGFKAGALKEGLEIATGEFIAIFDADFMPPTDFLVKTIPWFIDKKVAVVQTRWGHLNRNFSTLTQLQALALDAHFSMEQTVRDKKNYFLNFNGTAGVWRKESIFDAGNWKGDTLTEDLDLSYRAQLRGWKIKFLENQVSPAELPVTMSAIRSQQFRWTKGGAQNFKNNRADILKADISIVRKLQAMYHLFNSTTFVIVLSMALLSLPILFLYGNQLAESSFKHYGWLFLVSTIILFYYYSVPYFGIEKGKKNIFNYAYHFLLFVSFMLGLSLNNTIAVIEAYLGINSSFIRTPKFNLGAENNCVSNNKYIKKKLSFLHVLEGALALVFMSAIIYGLIFGIYGFIFFHCTLFLGFANVFLLTMKEYFKQPKCNKA